MAWIPFNANPTGKQVGDCTIRAIARATEKPWEETYSEIAVQGLMMKDMPSANAVWGSYLKAQGFKRYIMPNSCPDCYTLKDFCKDHPAGMYIVALQNHVVAVNDGDYFDTWDSGDEIPLYYFTKEEE